MSVKIASACLTFPQCLISLSRAMRLCLYKRNYFRGLFWVVLNARTLIQVSREIRTINPHHSWVLYVEKIRLVLGGRNSSINSNKNDRSRKKGVALRALLQFFTGSYRRHARRDKVDGEEWMNKKQAAESKEEQKKRKKKRTWHDIINIKRVKTAIRQCTKSAETRGAPLILHPYYNRGELAKCISSMCVCRVELTKDTHTSPPKI